MGEVQGVGGFFSRMAALFSIVSHIGVHGFAGLRVVNRLSGIYQELAKKHGTANVTEAMFRDALVGDEPLKAEVGANGEIIALILKYLPYIIALLASLFNFPIPPLPV